MSTSWKVVVATDTLPEIAKLIEELFEKVKPHGIEIITTTVSESNTEICRRIAKGEFHFGIGDFSMTAERLKDLDWTAPFQSSHLVIITRVAQTWDSGVFFQPFTPRLWGLIVATVAILTLVLLWLERGHIFRKSKSDLEAGDDSPDSLQGARRQLELLPGVQPGVLRRRAEADIEPGVELIRAHSLRGSGRINPEPDIPPGAQPGAGPQPEGQQNADPGVVIQPESQPGVIPQLGDQPGAQTLTPTHTPTHRELESQSLLQSGVQQGENVQRRSESEGPLSLGLGRILWWVHHSILYAHDKQYVKTFLGRVVAGVWLTTVLIMLTAYQAGLQATFTSSQLVPRFQSVEEVLNKNQGMIGMQEGTWYNEQHSSMGILDRRVKNVSLDLTEWDALLQSNSVDSILAEYPYAVLFTRKYSCDKYAISGLQEQQGRYAWGGWGWPFLKDADVSLQDLRRDISAAIFNAQVRGEMEVLQRKWMGHNACDSRLAKNQIDIFDVRYLLLTLGVITAAVFLISIASVFVTCERGAFSVFGLVPKKNRRRTE